MATQGRWGVLFVVLSGQILTALSHRIVNVASPTLTSALATDLSGIVWIMNAYQIVVTGLLLVFGRLADLIGRGRTYVLGLIVFSVGSGMCAAAGSLPQIVAFRIVQGMGGSMMSAAGFAIVAEFFPESQRGRVMGGMLMAYQVGALLGPSLGGFLVEQLPWQSIFLVNLVVGVPGIVLGVTHFGLRGSAPRSKVRVDYVGATLLLVAMTSVTLGLEGFSDPGGTFPAVPVLVVGAASVVLFLWVERRLKAPSLDMALFRKATFSLGVLSALLINIVVLMVHFLMPFYFEGVLHYPPSLVGLLLLIGPAFSMVAGLVGGSLADRFGAVQVSVIGAATLTLGMVTGLRLAEGSPWYDGVLMLVLLGVGIGFYNPSNNSAVISSAPRERMGIASATMQMVRNIGWSLGSPVGSAVFLGSFQSSSGLVIRDFQRLSQYPSFFVSSLHAAIWAGLLLVGVAAVLVAIRTGRGARSEGVLGRRS